MKKSIGCIKNIGLLFVLLQTVVLVPCFAQKVYKGQITVVPHDLKVKGDSLYVNLTLDMQALVVESDRSLELTPVLVGKDKELELPGILINGKRRHAVYRRESSFGQKEEEAPLYAVVRSDNRQHKMIKYTYSVKKEEWMFDARLDLKEDLCACAGNRQQVAIENLVKSISTEARPMYEMKLQPSYIKPQYEEVKRRSEEHQAYLDFPVAKTVILPEFGNNPQELSRLVSMIKEVEHDKNVTVTDVEIIGYASPEGSLKQNNALSKGRAEALKRFLESNTTFPSALYRVKEGGEDWVGLARLIESSYATTDKESLLTMLKFNSGEIRKQKIKEFNAGVPYKQMLHDLFPKLRRVVSVVKYNVRGFDVDEAKEMIKTRPQLLSLDEMFMVANKYPQGSDSFSEVFEIAVRLYPDNEIANLNAAASALIVHDHARAEKYLERANKSTPEYVNNQALLSLQKGNYIEAEAFFNQAIALGSQEARHNLSEMKRKLEQEIF